MSNGMLSPSDGSERDHRMYLEDMLAFCDDALSYTGGQDIDTLSADRMRLDATLRKLTLIGEAASRVPDSVRDLAPDIPWRKIVGTRNRLMHAYQGTEMSAVWSIVTQDLPALRVALQSLLTRV
jgi:uncharacterized protein with HEPN domain